MHKSRLLPLQALLLTTKTSLEARRKTPSHRKSQAPSPTINVPSAPPRDPCPTFLPVEVLMEISIPLTTLPSMVQPPEVTVPFVTTETVLIEGPLVHDEITIGRSASLLTPISEVAIKEDERTISTSLQMERPTETSQHILSLLSDATVTPSMEKTQTKVEPINKMRSANSPNVTRLTPEVYLDDEARAYLVRINGEVVTVVDTESQAVAIVDSIAEDEVKRLEEPYVKGLRRTMNNGTQVQLFTQTKGWLGNGPIVRVSIIDILVITKPCHLKAREIGK